MAQTVEHEKTIKTEGVMHTYKSFKIFNYSDFPVTPIMFNTFTKGFKCVPQTSPNLVQAIVDFKMFVMKLNLNLIVNQGTSSLISGGDSSNFKSTFNSPLIPIIEAFNSICESQIREFFNNKRRTYNQTREETVFTRHCF